MAERSSRPRPVLLIAETRPTLALGLKLFLANIPGTEPVAIMTGFDHVVDYAEHHKIGLIIVGAGMHGASPLNELRRLRLKNPSWRLALLPDVADRETIVGGLSAGARGIIPTSVEPDQLYAAVARMLEGKIYIPNSIALLEQRHPMWSSRVAAPPRQPSLTPRQFDVLHALAQGNSNKQIARILAISESTVSMHLNAAFHALGVHDRTSAALAFGKLEWSGHEAIYNSVRERNQSYSGRHTLM